MRALTNEASCLNENNRYKQSLAHWNIQTYVEDGEVMCLFEKIIHFLDFSLSAQPHATAFIWK